MLKPMPAAQPSLEAHNGEEEFALLVNSLPGHPKKSNLLPWTLHADVHLRTGGYI